nr:serpin family protein [candidate division Zixibacteria bacterium]
MFYFRKMTVFLLLGVGLVLVSCSKNPSESGKPDIPQNLGETEKALAESGNAFAFNLLEVINAGEENNNLFISPLSISYALGMAYNGAAGDTRDSIAAVLQVLGMESEEFNQSYYNLMSFLIGVDSQVQMSIANSMWPRMGFILLEDFVSTNQKYFAAEIEPLDFDDPEAADIINRWVAEKTNDKIESIVTPPISPETILFLINAVYFKGTWTFRFDPEYTQEAPFYAYNGSEVSCQMMSQKCSLDVFLGDDFVMAEIPYNLGAFNMTVLLPNPGVDINEFVGRINCDNWKSWQGQLSLNEVNLWMPRFQVETEYSLEKPLSDLGMGIAFLPYTADFSGITGNRDIYISRVKHKGFIEVNEEGTEAAAVTSIEFGNTSDGPQMTIIRLNRPFVYIIHEVNSGAILFMGKLMEP